jgi:cytoskeletal protein CcmA (bactofilin family)
VLPSRFEFEINERDRVEPVQSTPVSSPVVQPVPHPVTPHVSEKSGHTTLSEGSSFQGTLRVQGSLTVHGNFEGSVSCTENLLVGKTARVKADIEAKSAVVGGKVEGSLKVRERVELQTGCTLLGDVHARSFVIQDDCHYQGRCVMGKSDASHEDKGQGPELGLVKKA